MTALEYLEDWMEENLIIIGVDFSQALIKAKEMEKQQIIESYYYDPNCDEIKDDGEQYYNETFKSE
jgi:hypothetical protein